MAGNRHRSGFTLVELLCVVAALAVVAAILVPVLGGARGRFRTLRCASNLNQISVATKLYLDDHRGPPLGNLPQALGDYVDSAEVFVCPEDRESLDSYSEYYVARKAAGRSEFLVACPRHGKGGGAVGFGEGDCAQVRLADMRWDGFLIEPGTTVKGGQLAFADGSRVTIADNAEVGVLMSFTDDGVCHTVLYVPNDSVAALRCEVTPGSRFEVVTPASIAGVQGTVFDVATGWQTDGVGQMQLATQVKVYEGTVRVTDRQSDHTSMLKKGQMRWSKVPKAKAPADQKEKKDKKDKKDK